MDISPTKIFSNFRNYPIVRLSKHTTETLRYYRARINLFLFLIFRCRIPLIRAARLSATDDDKFAARIAREFAGARGLSRARLAAAVIYHVRRRANSMRQIKRIAVARPGSRPMT